VNLASLYRRGYISAIGGVGMLAYGIAAGAHIVLLVGIALLALAAFRFNHSRGEVGGVRDGGVRR